MQTFVFILREKRRGELTASLLEAHVDHLKSLNSSGALVICGPFTNDVGAIQILRANTRGEAIALFERDPFIRDKYYSAYDVYELHEANEANHWLMSIEQTQKNLKA